MSTSSIIQQSFEINLKIMRVCHLYPPKNQSTIYKIQSYLIYFLCVLPIPIFGILYLLLTDNLDMERVRYNAAFLAEFTCLVTKYLPFFTRGHRIRKCIDFFDSPIFEQTKEENRVAMKQCIKTCRRNTEIMLVFCVVSITCWVTEPLFSKNRRLPIELWFPFNPTENIAVYTSLYVVAAFSAYFCCIVLAVIDPIIGGLAYHATIQVNILKRNLHNLNQDADEEIDKENIHDASERRLFKNKRVYNKICKSVDHYQAIIEFVSEYEACFSVSLFSQFTTGVLVICFACLQFSEASSIDIHLLQSFCYLSVILGEIYFFCYYGTVLFEANDSLTSAIYMSEWFDFDIPSKKALLSIMQRTQKPMMITAAKLIDLSLVTFVTILRRIYSLIALLKNFQ